MRREFGGTYRGATTDERREQRRRRLLDAALDIIGTQGLSALTVRGVCEQARVGPRFFYESFPDLDALAGDLLDEIQGAALDSARAAIADTEGDQADKIRAGVAALIVALTDDPRRANIALAQAHGSEGLMRRRFEGMRRVAAVIMQEARLLLDIPEGEDNALTALAQLITGGAAELMLVWLDGGLKVERPVMIDVVADYVVDMVDRLPALAEKLES
ncbi:DNA-binding transcriptional repressor FabR [Nocardia otitidiscaviarum]|uniref:DNA-binding transcriptional repressor FabR n=1 Tax=Nocardia otitidiscaviarum TaxID=1823 RepID=A0A379JK50_9NOCA|nr:TetR/AcrR family transcriptional regulator [Nocardia otitidiscaviarum]MBF6180167.1 TetR/AcrR family transcriptional regulator [Nocardia otitidiscaviarum]MCP9620583.1 TetR/AcrR family transcriptional regulator [Nocardia otitidiscaviarum]QDP79154.1 TetR/AcrR family transcriptional regulator [Nocardia otitidiscaviarum]SUD49039.1 DNA-binding transcriptional repressor FabR [Nocardia otitidiscaviarum]